LFFERGRGTFFAQNRRRGAKEGTTPKKKRVREGKEKGFGL